MARSPLPSHWQVAVALLIGLGVFVLVWGLPQANQHRLPWRWRVGIIYAGLGLILWPPIYVFLLSRQLELGILLLFAPWLTLATFGVGIRRLRMADNWEPNLYQGDSTFDFGWVMRPHPQNPSTEDLIQRGVEDMFNPLAAILRRRAGARKPEKEDMR